MIKAVIFDMDGVLIDSVELGLRVRKKILSQHYSVDLDQIPDPQGEGHRAASTKTLLESVKNHYGIHIDQDKFATTARETTRQYLEEQGVTADRELVTFLEELRQHHVICAVVSSGLREGVNNKLNILGIGQYFSVIVTGNDVKEHKPNPEPYIYAMKKLDLAPEDCIIIEDSLTGIQAAKSAGCKIIGFTKYNLTEKPMSGVVAAISDWDDINYKKLLNL